MAAANEGERQKFFLENAETIFSSLLLPLIGNSMTQYNSYMGDILELSSRYD